MNVSYRSQGRLGILASLENSLAASMSYAEVSTQAYYKTESGSFIVPPPILSIISTEIIDVELVLLCGS